MGKRRKGRRPHSPGFHSSFFPIPPAAEGRKFGEYTYFGSSATSGAGHPIPNRKSEIPNPKS
jgi:hypothetical protein